MPSESPTEPEPEPGPGRRGRNVLLARVALATLILAVCLPAALVASVSLGLMLPTQEDAQPGGGRWFWVVSEGRGFTVKSKTEDRCGVPIFVGLEAITSDGFFVATTIKHRVWTHDPNRDLDDPGVLEAVRSAMLSRPDTAPWATALSAPRRITTTRLWLGTLVYGAAVVFPGIAIMWFGGRLAVRGWGALALIRARRRSLCTTCGYSLRGLDVDEAQCCPECGTHRAETNAPGPACGSRQFPSPA